MKPIGDVRQRPQENARGRFARYAVALAQLGRFQLDAKKWAGAEGPLREALAIGGSKEPDLWTTFDTKSLLGAALLGQKMYEQAEPLIIAGYEGLKARESKVPNDAKPRVTEARDRIFALYESWGKPRRPGRMANPAGETDSRAEPLSLDSRRFPAEKLGPVSRLRGDMVGTRP